MKLGLRELMFAVLLLGMPLGAWWFAFRPQNASNAEVCRQIEAKQAKLRELNHIVGTVGSLKKEIASLEKAIDFFQSKLPNEKGIEKVLEEVWRLADENQLVTKSIRTDAPRGNNFTLPTSPHAEQPITMELQGDFRGFYGFLQAIETQPRIVRIRLMKFVKLPKAPEGHTRVRFEMSVFFEPDGEDESCLLQT